MKKLKIYSLVALLFAVVSGLILTVSELSLRWYTLWGAQEKSDHIIETDFLPVCSKPNYEGSFWEIDFKTNRFGFRDEPNLSDVPDADEFRILSLGDSIGFGLGIPAPDHYTKVAERLLNDGKGLDQREFRIVNAGGMGYSPSSYYVWLKHVGLKLKPRLVIVEAELCNDISDEALLHWSIPAGQKFPDAVVGGRYVVSWDGRLLGTQSAGGFFFEKTYLYTDFLRRILNLRARFASPEAERPVGWQVFYSLGFDQTLLTRERVETGWHHLFTSLEATAQLLEENEIQFVLMILPSRYLYQKAGQRTQAATAIFDRAIEMAKERNLPYLDMSEAVRAGGGSELFFDFAHMTVDGNHVLGEALGEELRRVLHLKTELTEADGMMPTEEGTP